MRHVLVPFDLQPADFSGLPSDAEVERFNGPTMGTSWSVTCVRPRAVSADRIQSAIDRALALVIAQMSPWETDSVISRFNRADAGTWHTLPPEFFFVLRHALSLAEQTSGAYDPTSGALVDLWGFGPPGRNPFPAAEDIGAALARTGWSRIRLAVAGSRAFQPGGIALDFSSIAKGYAVDLVTDALNAIGVTHALVEIGGELRGEGIKPDGSPWWVALEGGSDTVVALHGLSVATSGDSQRSFEHNGQIYSHTIDPRTGYPVSWHLAAVTVLHRRCMQADVLATALLCLGPEEGFDFAVRLGVAARFLLRETERVTPAFAALRDA